LETLLTLIWYPCTVATLSRRVKTIIEKYFQETVDDANQFLVTTKLHDFGFRGCTSVEQSVIGGVAHLLNFDGTDTMSAAYYAQFHLNGGDPIGTSIPATEHSVMTSYKNEKEAILNMIEQFGTGFFAVVMDSYDYTAALTKILPNIAQKKTTKGGYLVLRPDSGDPVSVVMEALRAAEKTFGVQMNSKEFKVINGAGVIQGDGINPEIVAKILEAAKIEKFSAQNITFGMGGGLLQKVDRDTMSFATKLSYIKYQDGSERNVMKAPKTDQKKFSLPGCLQVIRDQNGNPIVVPKDDNSNEKDNLLKVVYDCGPPKGGFIWQKETFAQVRERLNTAWKKSPPKHDALSENMRLLLTKTREEQVERNNDAYQAS
jgi:nicotinic acid phosphoribosyltransferase